MNLLVLEELTGDENILAYIIPSECFGSSDLEYAEHKRHAFERRACPANQHQKGGPVF